MARRWILLIMTVLMCWIGTSAREKVQITNLFEGDSLAVLSEEQNILLDSAIGLLIENDSIVILPQEINLLIGDTAKVNYCGYPDWSGAFFEQKKNKLHLTVPVYAETPFGIIRSQMNVERGKTDELKCLIETLLSTDTVKQENIKDYSGVLLLSEINGTFVEGNIYRDGVVSGIVNGKTSKKAIELKTGNHIYPRYENLYEYVDHYKNQIARDTYRTFRKLQERTMKSGL